MKSASLSWVLDAGKEMPYCKTEEPRTCEMAPPVWRKASRRKNPSCKGARSIWPLIVSAMLNISSARFTSGVCLTCVCVEKK